LFRAMQPWPHCLLAGPQWDAGAGQGARWPALLRHGAAPAVPAAVERASATAPSMASLRIMGILPEGVSFALA